MAHGTSDNQCGQFKGLNNMGGLFPWEGHSIHEGGTGIYHDRNIAETTKQRVVSDLHLSDCIGQEPLRVHTSLKKGPKEHQRSTWSKCLHREMERSRRSLWMISKERWSCWWSAPACSRKLKSTIMIMGSIWSLSLSRTPGSPGCGWMWEICQGRALRDNMVTYEGFVHSLT